MTQSEEIVYWQDFDKGRDHDGYMGTSCRYYDPGLSTFYYEGFAERTGQPYCDPWGVNDEGIS